MTAGPPDLALVVLGASAAAAALGAVAAWWTRRATSLSARNFYLATAVTAVLAWGLHQVDQVTLVVTVPLVIGLGTAAAFGRRWRLSDLGAGEELRDHEQARRWIWQRRPPRDPNVRVRLRGQGELHRSRSWPPHERWVPLGADDVEAERVPRGDGRHLFVVGATGSGKTTTALRVASGRVLADNTALLCLDQKGDPPTELALRALAAATGRPFILFDPRDSTSDRWMPLWGDAPAETVARLVAGIQTSEPYYADRLRQHLTICTRVLHGTGTWPVPFRFAVEASQLSDFGRLLHLARTELPDDQAPLLRDVERHARTLASREGQSGVAGGMTRLELVVDAWRDVLEPRALPDGSAVGVALPDAIRAQAIVLWRTHVDAMPEAAAAMTALALGDIAAAAQYADAPWTLLADEVGGVMEMAADPALALLQRGRTHQGQVLMVTQSVADIEALTGRVGLLSSLSDNFAGIIAHRQTAPDSRDWLARLMGTRGLWQSTDQTIRGGSISGAGSRRRVREFRVPADTFASLGVGQCVNWTALGPEPKIVNVRALPNGPADHAPRMPADAPGPGEIPVHSGLSLPSSPDDVEDIEPPTDRTAPSGTGETSPAMPPITRRVTAEDV